MKKYLSLDVGGTNIKYGILNEEGEILYKDKFPTEKNKEKFLETIVNLAEKYKKEENIQALALSMPGVIDTKRGHLITAGALFELYDFGLKDYFEKALGIPVAIDNDVNCVALAEKWLGSGKDSDNFICIAIGTGIGGAIVIDGKLYRGHRFAAGEFGFALSRTRDDGDTRHASLSLTASTQGGLIRAYKKLTGIEINGEEIFDRYQKGEKEATKVFIDFYENLSVGIFNLIYSLDPEKVLIGGAISENKIVMEELQKHVVDIKNAHRDMKNLEVAKIEPCKFNNDSGIIGALYNYLSN